jgi:hypothetical protein
MLTTRRIQVTSALLGIFAVLSLPIAPAMAQDGNSAGLGNLAGAAEVCGFQGVTNQLRSQARDIGSFEGARQTAVSARQNCSDVSNTLRGMGYSVGVSNISSGVPSGLPSLLSNIPFLQRGHGRYAQNGFNYNNNGYNNYGNNGFNYNSNGFNGNNDPYSLGNLAGAAEVCGNGNYTNQLRSRASNQAAFENARNTARNAKQDCNQVNATLQQQGGFFGGQTFIAGGYAGNLGNLAGAAEVCGINGYTDALRNRSGDYNTFESARNRARNSKQDCNQVNYTLQQGNF